MLKQLIVDISYTMLYYYTFEISFWSSWTNITTSSMSSQYMTPAGELSCHEGEHETIKKMSKNSLE